MHKHPIIINPEGADLNHDSLCVALQPAHTLLLLNR